MTTDDNAISHIMLLQLITTNDRITTDKWVDDAACSSTAFCLMVVYHVLYAVHFAPRHQLAAFLGVPSHTSWSTSLNMSLHVQQRASGSGSGNGQNSVGSFLMRIKTFFIHSLMHFM